MHRTIADHQDTSASADHTGCCEATREECRCRVRAGPWESEAKRSSKVCFHVGAAFDLSPPLKWQCIITLRAGACRVQKQGWDRRVRQAGDHNSVLGETHLRHSSTDPPPPRWPGR